MIKSVTHKCLIGNSLFTVAWTDPKNLPLTPFKSEERNIRIVPASEMILVTFCAYRGSSESSPCKAAIRFEVHARSGRLHLSDRNAVIEGIRQSVMDTLAHSFSDDFEFGENRVALCNEVFNELVFFLGDMGIVILAAGVKPC